jgi:hypothetical protein
VAWATADAPGGPYTIRGAAIAPRSDGTPADAWDSANIHNPFPLEVDGKYYLYYTGNHGDGDWWTHRNHQRIGVAVADHPGGPWRRRPAPLLDVTPGSWDAIVANCPVVTRGGDGRFYMVYKGVSEGPRPFGGQVRMGLAIAERPEGPFVKQPGNFFDAPGVKFPSDDNYIWHDGTRFHAIVKDYGGHFQKVAREALVLFTSADCRRWELAPDPVLSTFHLRHADGTTSPLLHRLDQPQLVFDRATGRPVTLLLAVKERDDKDDADLSYHVQVPLRT